MTTNSQLSTTQLRKQKLSKQLEQEQNQRNKDHMEGFQCVCGEEWQGKSTGNKKHKWQAKTRQGKVKNGIGNSIHRTYIYNSWT